MRFGSFKVSVVFPIPPLLSSLRLPTSSQQPPLSLAVARAVLDPPQSSSEDAVTADDPLAWDGFLNAVPKSRVSHSRKRMRSANKGLKDRVGECTCIASVTESTAYLTLLTPPVVDPLDLVHCAGCGSPKLYHHICAVCYSDISKRQKMAADKSASGNELTEGAEAR